MIVISGALVLVALVLLVLGLTAQDLNFVYGSIAVSLISFVFLVIGILQRRGEQPAAAGAGAGGGSPVTETGSPEPVAAPAAVPVKTGGTGPVPVAAAAEPELEDDVEDDVPAPSGATVLVVPGRPRYHVEGCRYLAGKDVEEVDVVDARAAYSPCGVCKPDAALEAASAYDEPAEVVDSGVPGAEDTDADLAPEPVAPRRGSRRTTSSAAATAALRTTAAPRARKAPARKAAPRTAVVEPLDETAAAVGGPAADSAADSAAPAAATKATAARRGKVVVIPDRGRFHTPDCRFVRDALGTEELSRTQATKQGFQACGVCKP